MTTMSYHHRRCKSHGGDNSDANISEVPQYQHLAWHQLFGNKTPEQIAKIISEVWIDPAYKMIAVKK